MIDSIESLYDEKEKINSPKENDSSVDAAEEAGRRAAEVANVAIASLKKEVDVLKNQVTESLPSEMESLTEAEFKEFKTGTINILNTLAPQVESELGSKDRKDFEATIADLRAVIDSAKTPSQISAAVDVQLQKARNKVDSKNKGFIKLLAGEKLQKLTTILSQGTTAFDNLKNQYIATEQVSIETYLSQDYSSKLFESRNYKKAYNAIFDDMKAGGKNLNDNQKFNRSYYLKGYMGSSDNNLKSEIETKEYRTKLFNGEIVNTTKIDYIVVGEAESGSPISDEEIDRYPKDTKIIRIPVLEEGGTQKKRGDKLMYQYIIFGPNEYPNMLKAKKYAEGLNAELIANKPSIPNGLEDVGAQYAYKTYLDKQTPEYIKTRFYQIMDDAKSLNKDEYVSVLYDRIIELNDKVLVQMLLNKINNQENVWNDTYLGENLDTKKTNLSKISAWAKANLTDTQDTEQHKMLAQILYLESQISPENKETKKGIFQWMGDILKGNYDKNNPILKVFFWVAELVGGKKALQKRFAGNDKMLAQINDFYSKEYMILKEKEEVIEEMHGAYKKGEKKQGSEPETFKKIFDSKTNNFSVSAFKNVIKKKYKDDENGPDIFGTLDPATIVDITSRAGIQIPSNIKITKYEENKKQEVLNSKNIPEDLKDKIINAIFNDEKTLKSVKEAVIKSGIYKDTEIDTQTQKPRSLTSEEIARNGESISIGLSTYLVANKPHLHNVIVENNLQRLNDGLKNIDQQKNNGESLASIYNSLKASREKEEAAIAEKEKTTKSDGKDKEQKDKNADVANLVTAQKEYDQASFTGLSKIFTNKAADSTDNSSQFNLLKNRAGGPEATEIINRRTMKAYLAGLLAKVKDADYVGLYNEKLLKEVSDYLNAFKDAKIAEDVVSISKEKGIVIKGKGDVVYAITPDFFISESEKQKQSQTLAQANIKQQKELKVEDEKELKVEKKEEPKVDSKQEIPEG